MTDQTPTEQQLKEISDALIQGKKIEAIKAYRTATGTGLKEAKEAIETIERNLGIERKSTGCASVIAVGGALFAYCVYEFGWILA